VNQVGAGTTDMAALIELGDEIRTVMRAGLGGDSSACAHGLKPSNRADGTLLTLRRRCSRAMAPRARKWFSIA
jgi:hypothetical protein